MLNDEYLRKFRDGADSWVCDSYSVDIRYIALVVEGAVRISRASIGLAPLPFLQPYDFQMSAEDIRVGQCQLNGQSRGDVLRIIEQALSGAISVHGEKIVLPDDAGPLDFYSEMSVRDRWYSDLHVRISGSYAIPPQKIDFVKADAALRAGEIPFDGISEVCSWLVLERPDNFNRSPSLELRIAPPADLIINDSHLANDTLNIVIHARPEFETSRISVGVRAVPGIGLGARKKISEGIVWTVDGAEKKIGTLSIELNHADNALAMLTVGGVTVRRQWFSDPIKARNARLVSVQQFDRDLKMIKNAVLDSQDSSRFEMGISALLFLLGFSSAVQVETDSPDIVVATPQGRTILIECTLKTADVTTKIGKLVDRCNLLRKTFEISFHSAKVYGILVCGNPRDQIAIRESTLLEHGVRLFAKEDLFAAFERLRLPIDPDGLMEELDKRLDVNPLVSFDKKIFTE